MLIHDNKTPVVVLGAKTHGSLGIIRSLGRLGVPVFAVYNGPPGPATSSRYCAGKFQWDFLAKSAEESLAFLIELRRRIGTRPILVPTWDQIAIFVADHLPRLNAAFLCPSQPAALVHGLCSKREMYFLARQHGVPTPWAVFPQRERDVCAFAGSAQFPLLLKGIDGAALYRRTGEKMVVVHSRDELMNMYRRLADGQPSNLMLQEYIPGGDDTVWMFNGYFNEQSDCLAAFTGKKIRQSPIHTGQTSLGICLPNETVEKTTLRWMKALGYRGVLDIGYRFDSRDGQYKVLDVNPRIGATFRLFVGENGLDVARALYLDLTGQPVFASAARVGRKWIVEVDFQSFLDYRREKQLTARQWLISLRGIEEAGYFAADDLRPFFKLCALAATKFMGKTGSARRWLHFRRGARTAAERTPESVRFTGEDGAIPRSGIRSANTMLQFERLTPDDADADAGWRSAVASSPDRTVYQTPEWLSFLARTQHGEPVVAAIRDGNCVVAYFTGMIVEKFGVRILGSPFRGWTTSYMTFLIQDPGLRPALLLRQLPEFAFRTLRCLHLEFMDRRCTVEDAEGAGLAAAPYRGFEIDLSGTEDDLFKNLAPPCRTCIRKAVRSGVVVEQAKDPEFADDYYAQLTEVFARQRLVPTYGVDRVRALLETIQPTGMALLLRARDPSGRCIATAIHLGSGERAFLWGVASRREYQHLRPNELLMWSAMKYWKEHGCRYFDLGGGGEYKKKYGGVPISVPWFSCPRNALVGSLRNVAQTLLRTRQQLRGSYSAAISAITQP